MRIVEKGQRYIRKQIADTQVFKNNLNKNKSFTLHGVEVMNPFTIIPKPLYQDFDRKEYKRNTITFPIKIPINYRDLYLPRQARRKVVRQPNNPNYAAATGNQLLLSLNQYKDYSFAEILEMFVQLPNKPNASNLKLETNPLIEQAIKYMDKQIPQMAFDDYVKYFEAVDRLNFENMDRYLALKKNLFLKYYALKDSDKNSFAKCFLIVTKRFKLTQEEWDIVKEQTGRFLAKSSPDYIYEFSKMLIDKNIVSHYSDYLFEYHIMMGFWKKMGHFQLQHINYFVRILSKWKYYEFDKEFYVEELFPMIKQKVVICEDIQVLNHTLRNFGDLSRSDTDLENLQKYIEFVQKRILFVKNNLPGVYSTRIVDMVQKDIQKYRRKKLKEQGKEDNVKPQQKRKAKKIRCKTKSQRRYWNRRRGSQRKLKQQQNEINQFLIIYHNQYYLFLLLLFYNKYLQNLLYCFNECVVFQICMDSINHSQSMQQLEQTQKNYSNHCLLYEILNLFYFYQQYLNNIILQKVFVAIYTCDNYQNKKRLHDHFHPTILFKNYHKLIYQNIYQYYQFLNMFGIKLLSFLFFQDILQNCFYLTQYFLEDIHKHNFHKFYSQSQDIFESTFLMCLYLYQRNNKNDLILCAHY